jgi:hypothetical protein
MKAIVLLFKTLQDRLAFDDAVLIFGYEVISTNGTLIAYKSDGDLPRFTQIATQMGEYKRCPPVKILQVDEYPLEDGLNSVTFLELASSHRAVSN